MTLLLAACSSDTSTDPLARTERAATPRVAKSTAGSDAASPGKTLPQVQTPPVGKMQTSAEQPSVASATGHDAAATAGTIDPTAGPGRELLQQWLLQWSGGDELQRTEAAQQLVASGDKAVEQFALILRSSNPKLRVAAASYLIGRVGARNETVVAALADCLDDPDAALRHQAFLAIEPLPESVLIAAVPRLVVLIANSNEDESYRVRAIRLLSRLQDAAKPSLDVLENLVRSDARPRVRRAALAAISKIADPQHAERFYVELLRSSDSIELQRSVPMWLSRIATSDDALHALVSALAKPDDELQASASKALLDIGKPAVPVLVAALEKSASVQQKRYLIFTLGKLGPLAADAIPVLKKTRRDPNPTIAQLAAAALKLIER